MAEWINDINNYKLVPVTTGDGITYDLKMVFKGGSIDPLTATYNYAGKKGSKPKRNSSASPVYDIFVLVPQDDWGAFVSSVQNFDNEWLIKHPLYGDLKGHPVNPIGWDNTFQGDVIWNLQFQQSISEDFPVIKKDYKVDVDNVNTEIQTEAIDNAGVLDYTEAEISLLSDFIDDLEVVYENILTNEYANKIYDIRAVINATTFDAYRFMELTNDLLNISSRLTIDVFPASVQGTLESSVEERMNIISLQNDSIKIIAKETLNMILFSESAGASNIAALTATITTPSESVTKLSGFDVTDQVDVPEAQDYKFKKNVTKTINDTNKLYEDYINTLSEIDFEKDDFTNYIPSNALNDNVTESVLLAIQEVKELSEKAKEETIYITVSDTTPELLAFQLYGSATDENIESIINDNDLFGRDSIANSWRNMIVKRGTKIVYYA